MSLTWSDEQFQFLKDNYKNSSLRKISEILHKDYRNVQYWASKLNLKKNNPINVGDKFYQLTVLKRLDVQRDKKDRYISRYLCRCDCGTEKIITHSSLKSNETKSCGCLARSSRSKATRIPSKESVFNRLYIEYKSNAKNRNFEWNITKEEFRSLIEKNCVYCNSLPKRFPKTLKKYKNKYPIDDCFIMANGIDRIDSKQGYFLQNCTSCCGVCNIMKRHYSKEDFLNHINRIYEFNKLNE